MKRTPIARMSAGRRAELAEAGVLHPVSTFKPKPTTAQPKRPKDTGPKRTTRELLAERSGGMCEWPACSERATEAHHRRNRGAGGRKGEARERLNGIQWLLHACRTHHAYVTSPFGPRMVSARQLGWLLREHEDAARVPVWTRHHEEPIWLLPCGGWRPYEEGAA